MACNECPSHLTNANSAIEMTYKVCPSHLTTTKLEW